MGENPSVFKGFGGSKNGFGTNLGQIFEKRRGVAKWKWSGILTTDDDKFDEGEIYRCGESGSWDTLFLLVWKNVDERKNEFYVRNGCTV